MAQHCDFLLAYPNGRLLEPAQLGSFVPGWTPIPGGDTGFWTLRAQKGAQDTQRASDITMAAPDRDDFDPSQSLVDPNQ